jgi:hypothetical protein
MIEQGMDLFSVILRVGIVGHKVTLELEVVEREAERVLVSVGGKVVDVFHIRTV